MFQTKVVERKHAFFVTPSLLKKNCAIYEILWKKYCRVGPATNDNMAHSHCMLGTYGYKHTHSQYIIPTVLPDQWSYDGALMWCYMHVACLVNPLTPNDHYSGCTAPLTSKRCILYIYSTNIGTEYFKHGVSSPFFFSLQNAVCFIILMYLVPVLFTFYIQDVLKLKKIIPAPNS